MMFFAHDKEFTVKVKDSLVKHFKTNNIVLKPVKRISNSLNSILYVNNRVYFIKQGARVNQEVENINSISVPREKQFAISRVEYHNPHLNLLVLHYEDGHTFLIKLLLNANHISRPFYKNGLFSNIKLIANWLASFHNMNFLDERNVMHEEKETALKRLNEINYWLTSDEKVKIRNAVDSIELHRLSVHLSNKDFTPRNIIINNKERIVVVDWDCILEKPGYYNLAYFVSNIEARSRYYFYSLSFQRTLGNEFIKEYSKNINVSFDYNIYHMFRYLYWIEYLYDYEKKVGVFEPWKKNKITMNLFINNVVRKELLKVL